MKTAKIILVLSFILIITGLNSFSVIGAIPRDPGKHPPQKVITYVVKIDNSHNFEFTHHYAVVITDETGQQVAPAQTFRPGTWFYYFSEPGTVYGTRMARMVQHPITQGSWIMPPSKSLTGKFSGGKTYLFVISPNPEAFVTGKSVD